MNYSLSMWHAEGLRWIASLLVQAADRLEREDPERLAQVTPMEEHLEEVRRRISCMP